MVPACSVCRIVDDGWRDAAACKGEPTDLWYPEIGERADPVAIEICRRCPVAAECLESSFYPLEQGVWGGFGERQRRRLRTRKRRGK